MISPERSALFFLPIIFLSACSADSGELSESRWQQAYESGIAAKDSGDLDKAEENFRASLEALHGQQPTQKTADSNLALASVLLEKHDCAAALPSAQDAMNFFKGKWKPLKASSSLDESGKRYLNSMLVVGRALNCQHRYAESLPLLKRIRTLQEHVIVPVKFNHDLNDALRQALEAVGEDAEARRLREEIRSTESSVASGYLGDVSALRYEDALREGKSALQGGNFASAEKLLQQAVETAKKEDRHSMKTAEALLWLGDLYSSKGRYAVAKPMLEEALSIARKKLPKNDRDLKDYMQRLASVCANQNDWKRAMALDEEALTLIFAEEYGHDRRAHRSRDLMDALIDIYKKAGLLDKAEKMAHRKIAIEEVAYGKDSRKVGVSLCMLAEVMAQKKNFKEAEKYFEQSLEILKNNSKTDPPELSKIFRSYGNYLDKKGDKVRAKKLRDEEDAMNTEFVGDLSGKE
jgi:tetratricopeptide (TPR) repeat protein